MANNVSKRKINFLDFLLFVLIIAIVSAAIVSVVRSNPNISSGNKEIIYEIKCEMVHKNAADNIVAGDDIYDNKSNQRLGKVIGEPVITPVTIGNGFLEKETDFVTLSFKVSAKVWSDNGAYSIDDFDLAEGKTVEFHSKHFSFSGLCISIAES